MFHSRHLSFASRLAALFCLLIGPAMPVAIAQEPKIVDGVKLYLAIVPANAVTIHPAPPSGQHAEAEMHSPPQRGTNQYHVTVALFDAKSGARITDARVYARVSPERGNEGAEKLLDIMEIANSVTYGSYFSMPPPGPYRIAVRVFRPGSPHPIRAEFVQKLS